MHPNYWQITILLVVLFIIGLLYNDPTPSHSRQIIKTLVAKQLPTNVHVNSTHLHTYRSYANLLQARHTRTITQLVCHVTNISLCICMALGLHELLCRQRYVVRTYRSNWSINHTQPGFHPVTKIWGGSMIIEWVYSARQVPWDVF